MKLLMIHAWNAGGRSYRNAVANLFTYPSLTLAAIAALIPPGQFDTIDVIDEKAEVVRYDRTRYDLVLISAETSSACAAYRHAAAFRQRGAYVVLGGYHATALPEEALQHCDTVLCGPAEGTLPDFLRDFSAGTPQKRYRCGHIEAKDFPAPARDILTKNRVLPVMPMIANRGCGNACRYCSMAVMWKNDPRPVEQVIAELRSLRSKLIVFFDPNFFGDRDYAIALMKAMQPLKLYWVCNATADFGFDHELMQLAWDSGCRGVLIGIESVDPAALQSAGKKFRTPERYREIVANIHSHGMAVDGCFILGFDSDTKESILSLPDAVDELGLDLCRFAILTPYPGTAFYREFDAAGRILTRDWSRFNQQLTVFQPKNMTPHELDLLLRQVWKKAHTWRRIFRRCWRSPLRKNPAGLLLLSANIGFKFVGFCKVDTV